MYICVLVKHHRLSAGRFGAAGALGLSRGSYLLPVNAWVTSPCSGFLPQMCRFGPLSTLNCPEVWMSVGPSEVGDLSGLNPASQL